MGYLWDSGSYRYSPNGPVILSNTNKKLNSKFHHREIFSPIQDVDYTPDVRKRIRLTPPEYVLAV